MSVINCRNQAYNEILLENLAQRARKVQQMSIDFGEQLNDYASKVVKAKADADYLLARFGTAQAEEDYDGKYPEKESERKEKEE